MNRLLIYMTEKPQDLRGLDPEEEIRQLFQQLHPVPIPDDTYDTVHALLMNEVANTLSAPISSGRKPQFPLVTWLQRQFQRLPRFELGPSLTAAAMGAAVILLLVGFYPAFKNLITPDAKITVLYSNASTRNDVSVLIQRGYGESIELSEGDEATIQAGDKLVAWSSNVAIEYAEGWKSILKADSILDIESLSRGRSDVDIGLYLLDGEIYTSIERDLGFDGHIAVRTDSSLVEAIGTEFIVRTDTQDISYVAVLTGTVEMSTGTNSVYIDGNEQVLGVTGQSLEVSPLSGFVTDDVDLTQPYVTTKDGAVALYAKPDIESTQLAEMKASDRMELIAASNDEKWYVVCCIRENVLTWVNSTDVVPHGAIQDLGKFPELLPSYGTSDSAGAAEASDTTEPVEPADSSPSTETQTGSENSTARESVPTVQSTEVIPPTSTPVFRFTPPEATPTVATNRPAPPFLKPVLPLPGELVAVEAVPSQLNLSEVQPSSEAQPEEVNNQASGTSPTLPTPSSSPSLRDNDDENVVTNENQSPPQVLSEPTEAQNNIDGTGGAEPKLVPTNTAVPNTPTSTRRPNRSTNTPVPAEATATVEALVPATAIALDTPAQNNTPAQGGGPLEPADTPVPTEIPPTEIPPTVVQPTSVPPTATPVPQQPTATNTRRPNTSTNTPVALPTNTPQISAPTDTPVILPTNTSAPPTVPPTVAPSAPPTATPTVQIVPPTKVSTIEAPAATATPLPPAPTNTPLVVPPTAMNTATPQIVEPTPEPAVTNTSTTNPKLTPPTEPPDNVTPPSLPATSAPTADAPTGAPPQAATATPQIVVPTATPAQ